MASIAWLLRLPLLSQQQREACAQIVALEHAKREALKEARTRAEADRTSLDRFASYFLDCLILSGVPGIQRNDHVELDPTDFFPAILSADPSDLTRSIFNVSEEPAERRTGFSAITQPAETGPCESRLRVRMAGPAATWLACPEADLSRVGSGVKPARREIGFGTAGMGAVQL